MNLPKAQRIKANLFIAEKQLLIGQAADFLLGFCLSQARLFDEASPFAVALTAAARRENILAAFAGSCLGFLLRFNSAATVRQIAALTAVSAVNYIVARTGLMKRARLLPPLNAGICLALTGFTVLAAQGFDINGFMVYLCESVLSFGAAAFFYEAQSVTAPILKKEPLSQKQITAFLVSFCMLLMSLEGLELAGISLARIFAVFAVLCASKYLGAVGGCVCGGSMGFAMSLGSRLPFLGSAYTFGGLLAGLLVPMGQLAQASAFAICNAIVVLMNTGQHNLMPALYEAAVATVAFVLLPKKLFDRFSVYFTGKQKLPEFEMMKKALLMRFENVGKGLDEVAEAVEKIAQNMVKLDSQGDDTQSREIKQLVRDQFSTLAMAVEDVSHELADETRFDTVTAARVEAVLTSYGIKTNNIICSKTGEVERIEISAQKIRGKLSRAALMEDMEAACGYKLNSPTIREEEMETQLTFIKKPQFNLRIGKAQFTANDGSLCGDSCDLFLDKDGNQIIVISDGMGTGPRAAVDGAVAAWLFSKLIVAGLNFDSALRLSNSALIVKSEEETLATIDAAKINLYTGAVSFFKAGASNSLVCKGKKVYKYGNPSMPLGILREIEFDKEETTLSRGDILLMMSDGVSTSAYPIIVKELRSFNKKDPSALAERVVEIAKTSNGQGHADDITVIAVAVG